MKQKTFENKGFVMVLGDEVYNVDEDFSPAVFDILKEAIIKKLNEKPSVRKCDRIRYPDGFVVKEISCQTLGFVYNYRCINSVITKTLSDVIDRICPGNPWNCSTIVYTYSVEVSEAAAAAASAAAGASRPAAAAALQLSLWG